MKKSATTSSAGLNRKGLRRRPQDRRRRQHSRLFLNGNRPRCRQDPLRLHRYPPGRPVKFVIILINQPVWFGPWSRNWYVVDSLSNFELIRRGTYNASSLVCPYIHRKKTIVLIISVLVRTSNTLETTFGMYTRSNLQQLWIVVRRLICTFNVIW